MKTVQISFRLTEEEAHQLDQRRGRDTRGKCVRRMVLAGLAGQDADRLMEELARLREELAEQHLEQHADNAKAYRRMADLHRRIVTLREEIANAIGGVLMNMGRTVGEEQAAEFVRKVFPHSEQEAL